MTPGAFIRANTALTHDAFVPEIALHLATEITPIWQATEAWLEQVALDPPMGLPGGGGATASIGIAPPFWAFAWPGGLALARLLLDAPTRVRGLRVLDFASGCGIGAIAAAMAGATVEASEIDPLAVAATRLNAAVNGMAVAALHADLVGAENRWDVILAGDICYEAPMAARILPWLRAMAGAGANVLLADPGRAYFCATGLETVARFTVPTTRELEDRDTREVVIARIPA